MTRLQHLLYVLGAWRFQCYRRWIGGLWREIYIEPTPHSSECGHIRWEPCTSVKLTEGVYAFEEWPVKLPIARAISLPKEPTPCHPDCSCEARGLTSRVCGADPGCDREPLGIQYGFRAVRDRKST